MRVLLLPLSFAELCIITDGLVRAGCVQDDPLVKHCLDFIAVVASSVDAARVLAASVSGPAAATLAAAAEQGASELLPVLAAAMPAVLEAASSAGDLRIRAVALRTLHALLSSPGAQPLLLGLDDAVALLLRLMAGAAKAPPAGSKDVQLKDCFLVQVGTGLALLPADCTPACRKWLQQSTVLVHQCSGPPVERAYADAVRAEGAASSRPR
jgi:hypothetical protein